jgi:preprotein translocase subunit SecB
MTEALRTEAARIGGVVKIADIRLVETHFVLSKLYPKLPIEPLVDFETSSSRHGSVLVYTVVAAVSAKERPDDPAAQEGDAIFSVTGRFYVTCGLPEGFDFSEAEASAFGKVSAEPIAFPYVRELVHSLTMRAGLSQVVLDPLRVPIVRAQIASD